MERPEVPAMAELEAVLEDLRALDQLKDELKARKKELVQQVAQQVTLNRRESAAAYLYWGIPEIEAESIAEAFVEKGAVHKLISMVGASTSHLNCTSCSRPIPVSSRRELQNLVRPRNHTPNFEPICTACRDRERQQRFELLQADNALAEQRLHDLQTMPYREYLKTPEWEARRLRHLRSAGHRCQFCNASDEILDVHHRTYERRGREVYSDLIVLCRGCHELFSRGGKLSS